jgi:hypothetical protein
MQSLNYKTGAITLSVEVAAGNHVTYDVKLCGPLASTHPQYRLIHLLAAYEPLRNRIFIEDLRGNGYHSEIQAQGVGTLLVNTLLQILQRDYPATTNVYGEISRLGDPKEQPLAAQCAAHREGFWRSFGFRIEDSPKAERLILATLADLKLKRSGATINGSLPRFIDLQHFSINSVL